MSAKLTAYVPVLIGPFLEKEEADRIVSTIVEIIKGKPSINCRPYGFAKDLPIEIKYIKKLPSKLAVHYESKRTIFKWNSRFIFWLKFETFTALEDGDWLSNDWNEYQGENVRPLSVQEKREFQAYLILEALIQAVQIFSIAVNLARPETFLTKTIIGTVNGKFAKSEEGGGLFSGLHRHINKGWPRLEDLNINSTWEWYKRQPGILDGLSSTKIGRALNAFSHLLQGSAKELTLFWSMVGLEAIYVEPGAESKSKQLRTKLPQLVGSSTKSKRQIDNLYNFRSRLIHGEKNIPSCFVSLGDENDFDDAFYRANESAELMLFATLQQIAKRGLDEVIL